MKMNLNRSFEMIDMKKEEEEKKKITIILFKKNKFITWS